MQRYKCKIAYVGTGYSGYQVQPNERTIQSEIERALAILHKGVTVRIASSGRTDAGVHAKGQVIHFDSGLKIPVDKWIVALNSLLPDDISVIEVEQVSENFHSRYDAIGKEYRYFLLQSAIRDPFLQNYAYQYPYELNFEDMETAAKLLLGTHNFTSFCSARTEVIDRIRTIQEIEIFEENGLHVFRFVGNGFLYNMVRILVGTLLEVGAGRRDPMSIPAILASENRAAAGKTAPPQGLYLWRVFY